MGVWCQSQYTIQKLCEVHILKVPQIAHKFQDIESQIDATLDPDTCSLLASSVQLVFHLRCEQITEEPGSSLYSNPKTTLSISLYCVGYLGDTLG